MPTYTYEVDHGDQSPTITAGMEINGGKLAAVQFDAALNRSEKLEDALNDAVSALRYIRQSHGDLYGVGFDRVERKFSELIREQPQ